MDKERGLAPFRSERRGRRVTVVETNREVMFHSVADYELRAIRSASPSLNLTFFGITLGVSLSFVIALLTAALNPFAF